MLLAIGKLGKGRLCGSCQRQAALSSAAAAFLCAACSLSCAILPIGATGFRFRFLFSGCRYRSRGLGEESLQACREGRIRWATWPARMAEGRGQGCACSAWQRRSGKQKTEPVLEEEKVRSRALTRRGINAARASGAQKHLPQSPLNAGCREKLFRNIHATDRIGAYAVPRDAAGMHAPEQPIPSGLQIHAYQPMRLGKLLNRPTIRIHARASARRGQAP